MAMGVGVDTNGNGSRVGSACRIGFHTVGVGQGVSVGQGVGVKVDVLVDSISVDVAEGKGVWVAVGDKLASTLAWPVKARGLVQLVSKPTKLSTADLELDLRR